MILAVARRFARDIVGSAAVDPHIRKPPMPDRKKWFASAGSGPSMKGIYGSASPRQGAREGSSAPPAAIISWMSIGPAVSASATSAFFGDEYRMNVQPARFPKP